jgi:hypothetical protein
MIVSFAFSASYSRFEGKVLPHTSTARLLDVALWFCENSPHCGHLSIVW